jgi:hypothetical protein
MQEIQERINKFVPQYNREDVGLILPEKMEDGSWSAGWWDIRDWYEYYKLLTREEPKYSMKEYSHNSPEGRVLYRDAFYDKEIDSHDNRYVWLIVYNPNTTPPYYDLVHGSGSITSKGGWCFRYESEYDENGKLSTFYIDLDGNK